MLKIIFANGMIISIMMYSIMLVITLSLGLVHYYDKNPNFDKRFIYMQRMCHIILVLIIFWIIKTKCYDRPVEYFSLTLFIIIIYTLTTLLATIYFFKKKFQLHKH